ncbi:MAG: hypothetical protein M3033_14985 [Acidobacteriota bacterium]|nr:hypothetical protein [Acidobacteriota bacterium]
MKGKGWKSVLCSILNWSGKLIEGDADNEYAIVMKSNYKLASYTIEILLK